MLVLAACGSSSYGSSSPGTAAPDPATTGAAVVSVASTAKLGSVLTDSGGRTLYTLTNNGAPVPCTGQCATIWPPLTVPAGTTSVTAAPGVTGIGTTTGRAAPQVTEMNRPLYRFSGDTNQGDTNGDGVVSFGGTWQAVRSSADPISIAPAPAPAPTSGSSGGFGY
jgi:predicted lipoprotein with Yx(FWY)xxD motif